MTRRVIGGVLSEPNKFFMPTEPAAIWNSPTTQFGQTSLFVHPYFDLVPGSLLLPIYEALPAGLTMQWGWATDFVTPSVDDAVTIIQQLREREVNGQ